MYRHLRPKRRHPSGNFRHLCAQSLRPRSQRFASRSNSRAISSSFNFSVCARRQFACHKISSEYAFPIPLNHSGSVSARSACVSNAESSRIPLRHGKPSSRRIEFRQPASPRQMQRRLFCEPLPSQQLPFEKSNAAVLRESFFPSLPMQAPAIIKCKTSRFLLPADANPLPDPLNCTALFPIALATGVPRFAAKTARNPHILHAARESSSPAPQYKSYVGSSGMCLFPM